MVNALEFISQVRRELQRVTWPTQKETMGMTVAVILMVIFAMIYFFVADGVVYFCIQKIIGI